MAISRIPQSKLVSAALRCAVWVARSRGGVPVTVALWTFDRARHWSAQRQLKAKRIARLIDAEGSILDSGASKHNSEAMTELLPLSGDARHDSSAVRSHLLPRVLKSRGAAFVYASLFATACGAYYYARKIETKKYKLETVRIITGDGNAWRALPGAGNGKKSLAEGGVGNGGGTERKLFKVLHLSDLHLSEPESHKVDFIRKITDADYDLIVLTGDVFENYSGLKYAENLITRRPKIGAYAVLGNHDYYDYRMFHKIVGRIIKPLRHPREKRDVTPMIEALERGGWEVLRNESRSHRDHKLHVVGIDYPGIGKGELLKLADEAPEHHLNLCLFHVPKKLEVISSADFDIAFGGHTHGGQIRIPGIGPLITDSELGRHEASGVIRRGNTTFHISRGLGADPRSNIRFNCPPAATVVEIHHQMPRGV